MHIEYDITLSKGIGVIASKEVYNIASVHPRQVDNILYVNLDMGKVIDLILWGIFRVIHVIDRGKFRDLYDLSN